MDFHESMRVIIFSLLLLAAERSDAQTPLGDGKGMGSNSSTSSSKGFKQQIVEVNKESNFDIAKVGGLGRPETADKFAKIWELFRKNYALSPEGVFGESFGANTPNNPITQNEFLYYISENSPTIILTSTIQCSRCTGRGKRTALFNGNAQGTESQIATITCEECMGLGKINFTETLKLKFTGKLPTRPSKEERQALAAKTPPSPSQVTIFDKMVKQTDASAQPNDERVIILNELKAKAAKGDLDAEYKFATYFQFGKYPINANPKVFESMMLTLAGKGYNEACRELASIHKERCYAYTGKTRKLIPEEIAECIKWKTLYKGYYTLNFEVSEATQSEGKRRAEAYLSAHPNLTEESAEVTK